MNSQAIPEIVLAIVNIDPAVANDVHDQIVGSGAASAVVEMVGARTVFKNRGLREEDRSVLLVLTTADRFADLAASVQAAGGDAPFAAIGMPVLNGEDASWSWTLENLATGNSD